MFYYYVKGVAVYLIYVYPKNEENLTRAEEAFLKSVASEIEKGGS